ncbi:hypothetical protein L1887_16870 [Cichorium endivia]|nr:hypothetical protein L1887_16870 [Cichorium endivia]
MRAFDGDAPEEWRRWVNMLQGCCRVEGIHGCVHTSIALSLLLLLLLPFNIAFRQLGLHLCTLTLRPALQVMMVYDCGGSMAAGGAGAEKRCNSSIAS